MTNASFLGLAVGLLCSISSLAQVCPTPPRSGSFLAYTIQPDFASKIPTLQVDLAFRLPGARNATLHLPGEWQGQQYLYKAIHDLEGVSEQTVIVEGAEPSQRTLRFPPEQTVHLRYRVTQDHDGGISSETYSRAILQPSFFQLTGHNFLVYPGLPEDQVLPISFEWKNLPRKWQAASSLGTGSACQSARTPLLNAVNGLLIAGDFRILENQVHGKPVRVAIRGQWDFPDSAFGELATQVIGQERGFWNDFDTSNYLLSLLPSDDARGSYAGTALENSFTMFMSRGAKLDFDMKFVMAHEMFHAWNSAQLGEVPAQDPPFWLIEGFTDYYARILLLRAGLISPKEYVEDLNSAYSHYRTSPVLTASGPSVREGFYVDPDLQKMSYQRGGLLAATWDARIRQRSQGKQSLDDAMLALRSGASSREQVLTQEYLSGHFAYYVGSEVRADLTAYIDKGEVIPLPPSVTGLCVSVSQATTHSYEPGLDVEKMVQTRVISAVKSGSQAELAGLRDGQIVIERSEIHSGDPDQLTSLTVRDNTGEKSVKYFPRGPGIPISQYQLNPESAAKGTVECKLALGQ